MNSAPPKISRANSANSAGPRLVAILFAALVIAIAALVFFFNPSTHGFYPVCQFHRLTGLNCPGCGMTRALYALLHGDLLTALRDNALLVLAIPLLLARGVWFAVKKSQGRPVDSFVPGKYLWLLLVLALVFTVLRNLPPFAFLSLA